MSAAELDTTDLRRQIAVFEQLRAASAAQKNKFIDRSLIKIDREVKRHARSGGAFSKRSTGMLARKSGYKNLGDGSGVITAGVVYGMIQEFGGTTKPHIIRPKNGKALMFATSRMTGLVRVGKGKTKSLAKLRPGETGQSMAFANHVHHPGSRIKPKHYTRDSFLKVRPAIIDDAENLVIAMAGGARWP